MDGIIILNKPYGKTSHDMVAFMRRVTGIRKIGHTGTLDPCATGVLPICIGRATKVCDMLTEADKVYKAELALGMTTDTLDADGEILTEQPVSCTAEQIESTVRSFIGEIEQLPPMYSAIKQNGKKLYELAREGVTVERKKRRVRIYAAEVLYIDTERALVGIRVSCSKGTYIRTLCDDIGTALGCGAYLNALEREKSGIFDLADSLTEGEVLALKENGTLEKGLMPIDAVFEGYPSLTLTKREEKKHTNGVRIPCGRFEENTLLRVYGESGDFLSVSEIKCGELRLKKAFF